MSVGMILYNVSIISSKKIIFYNFPSHKRSKKKKNRFSLYFHIMIFIKLNYIHISHAIALYVTLITNNKLCYYVVLCTLIQQTV